MLARETSSPNNPVVMEGQPRPASHEIQPPAAGQEQHHSLYSAHLRQLQQLHSPLHPNASPTSASSTIPLPPPPPPTAASSYVPPPNAEQFTQSAQFQTSQPPQPTQPTSLFRSEDGTQQRDDFLLMQQAQEHQQFQFQQQLQQQQQQQQKRDASISRPQRDSALYRPTDQTGQNQLFVQQHGYAQLGQQAADRSAQAQQQSRSLLQPQNAMAAYPPNAQFDGNRFAQHPNNYMLHQSQQMQMPDDFSSGHPRATNMVNFPTPLTQFNLPRYSGAAPGSTIDGFSMNSVVNAADVHQSESNPLSRADALYRPLVPGAKMRNAYGKSPTMVGLQDMSNDAQLLLSPRPKTEPGDQNVDGSKADKQGTPLKKEQEHLQSPVDGVPSTVVADAGSATDIDGSLIARLRGFSGVNQGHQKQHMLGPGLPHNLFPGSIEPQSMGQPQGAHPDSYRAGMGGMRGPHPGNRQVGDAGNMLSPQRGMLPGPGQLPIGMAGGAGTTSAPEATPERPFRCKFCQASFGRRDNMQKHMRSIHMGERPFVCEICSYAFQKKDHKDKHVRTVHLKERPYQCSLCESRFGQKSDLTKHIRTVHQRIKPFRCEHCGLSFGHRGNKLRHVFVVHQKRKPHVCTICKQAFGERSNLAKHSLAVHKHALK